MVGKVAGPSYEDAWGQRGAAGPQAGKRPPRHFSSLCRRSLPHRLPGLPHRRRGLNLPCHPLSPCSGEVLPLPGSQTSTAVMPSARGSALLPVTSVVWFCSEPQCLQLGPHRRRSAHLPQHTQADVWAHTTHTLMWTRIATPAHGLPARGAPRVGRCRQVGLGEGRGQRAPVVDPGRVGTASSWEGDSECGGQAGACVGFPWRAPCFPEDPGPLPGKLPAPTSPSPGPGPLTTLLLCCLGGRGLPCSP